MSTQSSEQGHTKKVFKETVDIYRNDLQRLVSNPIPLILTLAGLVLFWIIVQQL